MNESAPRSFLLEGVESILDPVLRPWGFEFSLKGEGQGSGGHFAWGEFASGERRLELHYRHSLGLVRYHAGEHSASHEWYMRELSVWERCRYPGFSDEPLDGFRGLGHDLGFAADFLFGSAEALARAAVKEVESEASRREKLMASYVGDQATLDLLGQHFRAKRYRDVVGVSKELRYPDRLTPATRKMIEIASKKSAV